MSKINIINTNLTFISLRRRTTTRRIILHHTATRDTSAQAIHRNHRGRGFRGIGYHYLIRSNGNIEQGRPEQFIGEHTAGANSDSIGIALTGNMQRHKATPQQVESLRWLVNDIQVRYKKMQLSPQYREMVERLEEDIERVSLRRNEINTVNHFLRFHNGIDSYLESQRNRLNEILDIVNGLKIVGHREVIGNATLCPGKFFPNI